MEADNHLNHSILEALDGQAALLEPDGTLALTNAAWRHLATRGSTGDGRRTLVHSGLGANYLEACRQSAADGDLLAEIVLRGIEAVMQGARPEFEMEYPVSATDAQPWYALRVAPLADQSGRVIMTHTEVAARHRAEDAWRRYQLLFEHTRDIALFIRHNDGRILDANRAAQEAYGYTRAELLALRVHDLRDPSTQALVHDQMQQAEQGAARFETVHRCKDGRTFPVEVSSTGAFLDGERVLLSLVRDITERKRVEAALNENRQRLQAILDNTPALVYVKDLEGRLVLVNHQFEAVAGRPRQALFGRTSHDLLPKELADAQWADDLRVMQTQTPLTVEEVSDGPGGRKTYLAVKFPLFDAAGEMYGVCGISTDITERKQAEAMIRDLARFPAENPNPVLKIAQDGTLLFANSASARLLAIWGAEAGRQLPEPWRARITRALDTGSALEIETADDTVVYALTVAPVAEAGYVNIYGSDITQHRQAEARLRLQGAALEAAANAIFITDRAGIIEWVNPAYTRLTGYAAAEVIGRDPRLLKSGRHDQPFYAQLWSTILAGQVWHGELVNRRRDGQLYYEEQTITPVLGAAGQITHFVAVKQDVSRRKQRERELSSIAAMSAALRAAQNRAEMLPIIQDQIMALSGADGATLAWRDEATGRLTVELGRGQWAHLTGLDLPPDSVTASVLAEGQPYVNDDVRRDERFFRPALVNGLHAAVCVPLMVGGQTVGALWAARQTPFEMLEVRVLSAVADIAASALHRAALHEQTERRLEQVQSLRAIDQAISGSVDVRVVLNVVLEQVITQLRVDAACVLLLNPYSQTLEHGASRGFRTRAVERSRIRLGEGAAGRVALERQVVAIPNLAEPAQVLTRTALLAGEGFVAYWGVPLISKGEVMGILEVFQRTPLAADGEWRGFLEALAGQAAIAVDNTRLFDRLQRSNTELVLAYDATIEGWSRALDLRDRETEGHTRRVAEMTLQLARALGQSDEELVHLRRGALLHDIGKMGVPDTILLKPGPLTGEEWVIMRQHPTLAYEMLAPIAFLRPALDIPYCHHEKWDGTGYPRGLKGEAIPLAARIFAVPDVWDALKSDRPYRASWPDEQVRAYVQSLAGTHFDPQIVDVFLRLNPEE